MRLRMGGYKKVQMRIAKREMIHWPIINNNSKLMLTSNAPSLDSKPIVACQSKVPAKTWDPKNRSSSHNFMKINNHRASQVLSQRRRSFQIHWRIRTCSSSLNNMMGRTKWTPTNSKNNNHKCRSPKKFWIVDSDKRKGRKTLHRCRKRSRKVPETSQICDRGAAKCAGRSRKRLPTSIWWRQMILSNMGERRSCLLFFRHRRRNKYLATSSL